MRPLNPKWDDLISHNRAIVALFFLSINASLQSQLYIWAYYMQPYVGVFQPEVLDKNLKETNSLMNGLYIIDDPTTHPYEIIV